VIPDLDLPLTPETSTMDGSHLSAPLPLICFSHLPWRGVFQRPQHILSRFRRSGREVIFIEEDRFAEDGVARMATERCAATGVLVATPLLAGDGDRRAALRGLLDGFLAEQGIAAAVGWYYTPMALPWSAHLPFRAVVYDCMDELSAFRFAPAELPRLEAELMQRAEIMFTGGASLFEAKRNSHSNIFCEPSGVDLGHFARARGGITEPADQARFGRPKLGYFGVIDERIDLVMLRDLAALRPDWEFVMVGPLAKITEAELPRAPNLHWLGPKPYGVLPEYLGHWDVALMPFQLNEATRFISPTKAPEYLAGGVPIVSTPIADVVSRWRGVEEVRIAHDAPGFVAAAEALLARGKPAMPSRVEAMLGAMSWDGIVARMAERVEAAIAARGPVLAG